MSSWIAATSAITPRKKNTQLCSTGIKIQINRVSNIDAVKGTRIPSFKILKMSWGAVLDDNPPVVFLPENILLRLEALQGSRPSVGVVWAFANVG